MDYDKIIKKYIEDTKIKYGIIFGNEKFVFIKTGADGNIREYKDKYLKMSHRVHERMVRILQKHTQHLNVNNI